MRDAWLLLLLLLLLRQKKRNGRKAEKMMAGSAGESAGPLLVSELSEMRHLSDWLNWRKSKKSIRLASAYVNLILQGVRFS